MTTLADVLKKLRPLTAYGRVGTRDDEQALLQKALDEAIEAAKASLSWNEWRKLLAEKVDAYIQAQHDDEEVDEMYDDLKAHILKTPFAAPRQEFWLYELGNAEGVFQGCTGPKAEEIIRQVATDEGDGKPFVVYKLDGAE